MKIESDAFPPCGKMHSKVIRKLIPFDFLTLDIRPSCLSSPMPHFCKQIIYISVPLREQITLDFLSAPISSLFLAIPVGK